MPGVGQALHSNGYSACALAKPERLVMMPARRYTIDCQGPIAKGDLAYQ